MFVRRFTRQLLPKTLWEGNNMRKTTRNYWRRLTIRKFRTVITVIIAIIAFPYYVFTRSS